MISRRAIVSLLLTAALLAGGCGKARPVADAKPNARVPILFHSTDPDLAEARLVVFGASAPQGPFEPLHREPIRWRKGTEPAVVFVDDGLIPGARRWYYLAVVEANGQTRKIAPVTGAVAMVPSDSRKAPTQGRSPR